MKKWLVIASVFLSCTITVFAQNLSNLRTKKFPFSASITIDSLNLAPNSVKVYINSKEIDSSTYKVDYISSKLKFNDSLNDSIFVVYRVLPYDLKQSFVKYRIDNTEIKNAGFTNPFVFSTYQEPGIVTGFGGVDKRGSISRGISFGNNQDVIVNSDLNLQMNGNLTQNVKILAAISDKNIPLQADGNTQQLQEFDQIFVKIYTDSLSLIAGDFTITKPEGYFLNYYKRGQGLSMDAIVNPLGNKRTTLKSNVSGAISRGKFTRNIIQGIESNQGPYRLRGAENESYIIVLSGTEYVYINGKLLTRGQNNDYIINYNTAEITFTPNQLITKDVRIVVEFEYSDKNYTRTMLATSNKLEYDKLKLRINYLSEQDSKNQPLLQNLTENNKSLLEQIGDSLEKAVVPNIQKVTFNTNEVLYKKIDSLGFTDIFVHTTNPNDSVYRLSFSNVGSKKGNYVQDISGINGRVFKWVAPVAGISQGNYEPVTLLITPKGKQIATFGADYELSKKTTIKIEYGISENDINSFSRKNKEDDIGHALKVILDNEKNISKKDSGFVLKSKLDFEHVTKNFTEFNRYRPVEFNRKWNIGNNTIREDDYLTNALFSFQKPNLGIFDYSLQSYNKKNNYQGIQNSINTHVSKFGYNYSLFGSYLNSADKTNLINTEFYTAKTELTKGIRKIIVGINSELEDNRFRKDTLLQGSYSFLQWGAFISNSDSSINLYRLSYVKRYDDSLKLGALRRFTNAENIAFDATFRRNPASILKVNATYRTLNRIYSGQREENILSRIEYDFYLFNGLIRSNTYYEIGSGLELRREFEYLQVPAGQGTHTWIDSNGDGLKTLDEFQEAVYYDQKTYIKVYRPNNSYIKVFNNQFSESIFLKPNPKWESDKGFKKVISKFSAQSVYRISRKNDEVEFLKAINPFASNIAEDDIKSISTQHRHTLFFNRTNSKFGLDINYRDVTSKNLLTNGFENRYNRSFEFNNRTALSQELLGRLTYVYGKKLNESEYFKNQNYLISYHSFSPKLLIQPSINMQTTFSYELLAKSNLVSLGGQQAYTNTLSIENRYNVATQARLTMNLNYINNKYNAPENTSVAYEMLQSLQIGNNILWNVSFEKQFKNKIQLSINYEGRKSNTDKTIHTGSMQVRAFF